MTKEDIVLNNIKTRRSIFPPSFIDKPLDRSVVAELLEYANMAPTHKRTQPWRFTVFIGNGLVRLADEMARLYEQNTNPEQYLEKKKEVTRDKILRSGAIIACNVHYSGLLPEWEETAALACAIQNLWLAANAKGIGGYWSSPGDIRSLNEFLKLDDNEACLGLFYMGNHNEADRLPNREPVVIAWEES